MMFQFVGEVVLAICLSFIVVQGQEEVSITTYPFPAIFPPGGEMSIICEHAVRLTFDHMVHPTFGIISVSTARFVIDKYNDESILTILNAMQSDEGRYKCVLRDGAATVESEYVETSFRLPVVITPLNQGGNITVVAGDSFNLTCAGENVEVRRWLVQPWFSSNRAQVTNTSDGRITVTPDAVQFRGIRPEDEALYSCMLGNSLGWETIFANVTVVVRVVASVTPDVQVVEEGAMATISCHVTGSMLEVTWRDPDNMEITVSIAQSLGVTIRVVQAENSLTSTLMFASMSGNLAGQYTCRAVNSHGTDSSVGYIRLQGTPDPPENVRLTLINRTNILVAWEAPNSDVTQYVVTWEAVTGSFALEDPQSDVVNASGDAGTSYVITNLHRLTTYSVVVHGINSNGIGMVSSAITATTTAIVPSAPLSVVVLDIGPSSVRVEWSATTLPTDDGGSPLTTIRLTYKAMENGVWPDAWSSEEVIADVGRRYALVSGLRDRTTYQIRMEVSNEIGYGPGTASASFKTPQPGFPGSPSHVVARDLASNSAVVCWRESAVGKPFTLYSIEIHESGAADINLYRATEVESFPNCSTGVLVSDLQPGTCYSFVVYVQNSLGVGQPSPISEEYCTATSCGAGAVCSQGELILPSQSIAGIAIGSVVFLAILITITACLALRQYKKYSLQRSRNITNFYADDSNSYDSKRDSEQSIRSSTGLLASSSPRNASFESSLQPSSADSLHHSPGTATTIVSNPEQNPFDFSSKAGLGSHVVLHTGSQPVLHPHQEDANMDYPHPVGTNTEYPQPAGANVEHLMYPILENPPPYPHQMARVFPTLAQPTAHQHHQHYPAHVTSHGVIVMTDNPNYEEKQGNHVTDVTGEHTYYGDHMSEAAESEVSNNPLQIPTPHFGESYSQSGYSPVLQRSQETTEPNTEGSSNTAIAENTHSQIVKNSNLGEGLDDDTEFVENDAYVTFAVPKFRIVSEERGSVFDTVKVK